MRPPRQQVFRSDAASKLDDIELVAALLVRDVAGTRALMTEHGVPLPVSRPRRREPRRRHVAAKALRIAGAASELARLASHPRLYAGLGAVRAFIVDVVIVLSGVSAIVAAVAAAFALA